MAVNFSVINKEWLVQDAARAILSHDSRETLVADGPARETIIRLSQENKEWLVEDKARGQLFYENSEWLTQATRAAEPSYLFSEFTEVLYRQQDVVFFHESRESLFVLNEVPSIHAISGMVRQRVWQKAIWPTVADTISTERALSAVQIVLRKATFNLPQSLTSVLSAVQQEFYAYPMGMPFGIEEVRHVAELVLQSDDKEHVSISMDYVSELAALVLRSEPLAIYKSDVFARSVAQTVLRRTPMGFLPQSTSTVYQSAFKVLQKLANAFLPQSNTQANQSLMIALQKLSFTPPQSDTRASQSAMMALQHYEDVMPDQGTNEVRGQGELVLQASEFVIYPTITTAWQTAQLSLQSSPLKVQSTTVARQTAQLLLRSSPLVVQSTTRVQQNAMMALQAANYPLPENMTGVFNSQTREVVIHYAQYSAPDVVISYMRALQVRQLVLQSDNIVVPPVPAIVPQTGLMWHIQTNYPLPGDIIPPTRSAIVPSLSNLTLQKANVSAIQSYSRLMEMRQVTLQHAEYDTPENIFNKGIFVWQASQLVARKSEFPDPSDSGSKVRADMVIAVLATVDTTFPDPTTQPQPVEAQQVLEQVAMSTDFPDPTGAFSSAKADLIGQLVARSAEFPDVSKPLSRGELTQVIEQCAATDSFPDPATLMSPATSYQVVEQLSQSASYPDPSKTGSTISTYHVSEMVATRDTSMNGVPEYAIKHRPLITVNIVYSTKS